ncbi:MAG: RsmB/NOP family class I SAM-dependent RNA methyltransferase [Candidatus Bathyarchaeia archaeon]
MRRDFFFSKDVIKHLHAVYGDDVAEVVKALKTPGLEYSIRVNTLKANPEEVCAKFVGRGLKARLHSVLKEIILIHVEGPFPVPSLPGRVVVDKYAAEAVLMGSHVYAPGVKECRGLKKGDEVSVMDRYFQVVGGGVAKMSESEILRLRRGLAVEITHPKYRVPSLRESKEFEDGYIYPQSLPASLTSRVLDPQPGETILDLNCAPGGKLSHISQLMGSKGLVIGVDCRAKKIEATRQTLSRLGCFSNVRLIVADSRYLDIDYPSIKVDRCLIDPPCSALGLMPKLYAHTTEAEIDALANYQRQFIRVAAKTVKPGGRIVYSVCTLTLDECEKAVKFAVESCGLKVEEQEPFLGSPGLEWVTSEASLAQRFHPHVHGSGYFIACFRRPVALS